MPVTVVVLYGPKGAGKSQVAQALRTQFGVAHLDVDALVLDLTDQGVHPDPENGWLAEVEFELMSALDSIPTVSVEATGAWRSDWKLADDLEDAGQRVVRVWVFAPLEVTLARLAARTTRKVPVSEGEARSMWTAACSRAEGQSFDLVVDTGRLHEADLPRAVAPLAPILQ